MEVDIDGTMAYPEPQITAKDNGKCYFWKFQSFLYQYVDNTMSSTFSIALKVFHQVLVPLDCLCEFLTVHKGSILCQLKSILGQNLLALKKSNL